ncbi:MAG TPA: diacylglycerol kinase family protein [Paracoccaceae bacterium]|nr:diacylglycerol kinase family protein [Paracoccaceae bacterium]
MRVLLLHNPESGSGDHSAGNLAGIFESAGHDVVYRHTKKDEIRREDAEEAEIVVVAGGDGTIGKVVRALAPIDRPFAFVPLGTANNITRCLGLLHPPEAVAKACGTAPERELDIGIAEGPWGDRIFIEGVGLGAFASLVAVGDALDDDREGKEQFGEVAPQRFVRVSEQGTWRIEIDGEIIPDDLLLAELLNMPEVGPQLPLGPAGWPDDGLLTIVLLRNEGRDEFAQWLDGERRRPAPGIETRMGRRATFEWTGGALRIDDDFLDPPQGLVRVSLRIAPEPLRVVVPKEEDR